LFVLVAAADAQRTEKEKSIFLIGWQCIYVEPYRTGLAETRAVWSRKQQQQRDKARALARQELSALRHFR